MNCGESERRNKKKDKKKNKKKYPYKRFGIHRCINLKDKSL